MAFPPHPALFSLFHPSTQTIQSHLQATVHPQRQGITKVLFFKAGPVRLLPRVCGCGSREGGKLLRPCSPLVTPPCRPPPQGQPFEGVITEACITRVTADGGWSQLMKPLKLLPFSWFLLKLRRAGPAAWLSDSCSHRNREDFGRMVKSCILAFDK